MNSQNRSEEYTNFLKYSIVLNIVFPLVIWLYSIFIGYRDNLIIESYAIIVLASINVFVYAGIKTVLAYGIFTKKNWGYVGFLIISFLVLWALLRKYYITPPLSTTQKIIDLLLFTMNSSTMLLILLIKKDFLRKLKYFN
ncbi:hypothetical protein A2382_01585 [Candidatus Woesebacteria bacterium RIFOXYB1_FULL_38_16]|uniref:Uncharacterized protein n=1 Tax=Candidatus Woesebacteria bacterium RIFOXYB1_FULL_38_16 TaxID=1802538 RepID=A0A1F8CVM0_9BACT|nr:MAG: hypothetical protein A2191_03170 [Candidatus Woesebacteria bacterium RIFOXYA1_FULL_38_9]OGM80116.1 MAG: hypothetical protein A2382_01585 [Candidatus Woesebacteria bacterium RIFOXYB1_FULL_38_16]